MSKKELLRSYKSSLNVSLLAMAVLCLSLLGLLFANNQEAIMLFFYNPLLFAIVSGVISFFAVPLLTIAVSFLRKNRSYYAS